MTEIKMIELTLRAAIKKADELLMEQRRNFQEEMTPRGFMLLLADELKKWDESIFYPKEEEQCKK